MRNNQIKGIHRQRIPRRVIFQIAQTLINLPDHTPPLPTVKETGNSRKNDFDFSASKETNAAEVLMNLGNLTETRTSPTKHEEKKSKGAGNREYSSSGKSCPPAQTKIKLPDNITVTKVVKPPQSSPNHTKNLTEGRQVDGQSENSERVKLKKVVPKKRKPNIDVTEEIVLHKAPEPKTVVTVPSPAASPKKIIKIKSQMKSPTQPACPKTEESVFDISNMPIVLTDDVLPVRTVEKYSVIVPEGKTSATTSKSPTTTTTSNGREQGRVLKGEEVVVSSKSALVKRIKLLGNQKERSGSSSPEVGSSAVHKLATERRLIKLPPKKEERKLPTTSIGVGSTVVLVPQSKVPGQPLSPTKIIYSSGSFSTAATTSAAANPPVTLKISKPQVIQGKSGGQIVITSKGKVITKQSDMITTTASKVTEVSTTFKMAEGSKMSANPAKLIIKSPAKIHVQSQEIIYKPPKEIAAAAAKTTASIQPPKAVEVVGKADGESQKKVLRRIKRPRRLEIVDHTASHSGTNTQTIVVQEVPPLAPITTESLTSNCVKKVVSTAASDDAATTLRLKTSAPKSPVKSNKQTQEKIESGSSVKAGSGSTDVTRAVAATREKSEKVTMAAEGPGLCPSLPNPESTSNIQDILMNLGNLTETRTSPTKHEEKKSKGAGNREYSSSGKSCPPAQTKIKLPDNVTVTKVVKPPQSSPNHTKNLTEGRQVDGQSENSERVKLKKVVPKKRKPNIDVTEEIVLHKAPEPKTVVTVPPPAASPKKIIKIKSQMKSPTQPACPKTEESVFDISNMPIVLTDDVLPVRTVEKYSVIVPEGKTSATTSKSPTTTTTSNGREQGRVLKGEEVVVSSKSALVKRIKLLGNQKERSGSSSPEVGSSAVHKLATERRLIKLPPKKEERKLPTTSIGVGSTVVLVPQSKVPGQPLSPTKIIYSSGSFSTAATTSAAANLL
uniref:Uncharacterized protein n=1 Tax=Lutzomyia longipalpis TaxID=7200 RepID=A0A1B0CHX4_LUTLO